MGGGAVRQDTHKRAPEPAAATPAAFDVTEAKLFRPRPSGDRAAQHPRTSAQRRDGLRGGDHGTRRVRQDDPARGVGRARPTPVRVGLGGRGRRRWCVPGTRRGRARSDRADRAARARVHRVADGSQLRPGAFASEFGARHADAAVRARPGRPRPPGGAIGHGRGVDDRRLRPRGLGPGARDASRPGRRTPPPARRRSAGGGGRRGPRAGPAPGVSAAPRCRRRATKIEAAELTDATEGWPVGLYLAALSLQEQRRSTVPPIRFTGDDRFVVDYVRSEVLGRLSRERQRFLTRTSILDRLNGSLCDAVMERSGSLVPSSRSSDRTCSWCRSIGSESGTGTTTSSATCSAPSSARTPSDPGLHRRAADRFEEAGMLEEAFVHAHASGDEDRAAELLQRVGLAAYRAGASPPSADGSTCSVRTRSLATQASRSWRH